MPGLDSNLIGNIDYELAMGRIKTDVRSDFILAPHYSAIYEYVGDQLVEKVKGLLRSGEYAPALPIKADIPKSTGLTRPGAILRPVDRLVYQMLVDTIGEQVESQLSRSRVFSHVLLIDDPEFRMFRPSNECWHEMEQQRNMLCQNAGYPFAIKADVVCHFERIYQHSLINLLRSSGCDPRAVNLLEEILRAFTQRKSFGIIQGVFPSDLLGNFSLVFVDSDCEVNGMPSVRYVDDIYIFCQSEPEARKYLVKLCSLLRDEGLNLNESKTKPIPSENLYREETKTDRLFEKAKQEIKDIEIPVAIETPYGFEQTWIPAEEVLEPEEIELEATKELFASIESGAHNVESIEKFCLPIFSRVNEDVAVERSLQRIIFAPHLSRLYCSYLLSFACRNSDISSRIESLIQSEEMPYDWPLIWPLAILTEVDVISEDTVNQAIRIMEDSRKSEALRSIAVDLIAKHGNASQRRLLKNRYEHEPSNYVREAILFATRYFPGNERNSCLGAWGSHSLDNSLIAAAVRAYVSSVTQ